MPNTMSPVRKENPASQRLVLRRNILNLNFNLDMSYAIPSAPYANTVLIKLPCLHVRF